MISANPSVIKQLDVFPAVIFTIDVMRVFMQFHCVKKLLLNVSGALFKFSLFCWMPQTEDVYDQELFPFNLNNEVCVVEFSLKNI